MIGEAPTLDLHATTAVITQQITWHMYETLYTYDKNLNPIPMLAEKHVVGDNGRRYTITLRKGVRFHNGKEMTSADVVPSLQHWAKLGTTPKAIWKNVEALEAKDPYTVVIYLKEPSGSLLFALGSPNNGGAIYPKEVVAAAGDGQVKEYIGTGPYRFVEHKPDRHVRLARFKEYSARSEPPNGYGGKRTAYIDEIYFIPVPEASVRLAGDGDRRVQLRAEHPAGPGRPRQGSASPRGADRQAVRLDHRRAEPQGRRDGQPQGAAGLPGRARHGADHVGGHRQQGLLPARRRALLPRAGSLSFAGRHDRLQPEEQGQGAPAPEGSRLQRPARALGHHQGIRVDVQHGAHGLAADGGRGLQGRSPGRGLGDARPASQQARALRHLLHGLHHRSRTRRSPRASSATGQAGGASRRRTSCSPRWRGRPTPRSAAR